MKEDIINFENSSVIICGDWNVVQDMELDSYNILHDKHSMARAAVQDIKNQLDLLDPWRTVNPDSRVFTWHQANPVKQSRLDYFLISEDMFSNCMDASIIPGYKTDHSAITLKLSISASPRGPGYWKFNSKLLRQNEYIQLVKKCITNTVEEYYCEGDKKNPLQVKLTCNNQLFFEILKMIIRSESITYSQAKAKQEKQNFKKMEAEIHTLHALVNQNNNPTTMKELKKKQADLEEIRKKEVEGIMLRSKARWYESGEKNSKYFLNLEKRNYTNKTIKELTKEDGTRVTDPKEILNQQKDFYEKLYQSNNTYNFQTLNHFFNKIKKPQRFIKKLM